MGPPNKTTTELVSNKNTLNFIDYKLHNWDNNPTHCSSGGGKWPQTFRIKEFLKGGVSLGILGFGKSIQL